LLDGYRVEQIVKRPHLGRLQCSGVLRSDGEALIKAEADNRRSRFGEQQLARKISLHNLPKRLKVLPHRCPPGLGAKLGADGFGKSLSAYDTELGDFCGPGKI
jgi:hypothetical protein